MKMYGIELHLDVVRFEPLRGSRSEIRLTQSCATRPSGLSDKNPSGYRPETTGIQGEEAQNKAAARDATGVSTVSSGRRFCNFVGHQQLAYGAPVSGMPFGVVPVSHQILGSRISSHSSCRDPRTLYGQVSRKEERFRSM